MDWISLCGGKCHASALAVSGEPSAPKLEGQMGEDGNSIKVNLIKQDDGGSPIRHYLVKYRTVSASFPRGHPCPTTPAPTLLGPQHAKPRPGGAGQSHSVSWALVRVLISRLTYSC